MKNQVDIFIILGATASGKEQTALYVAEKIGAEIISVDSMKVYQNLDIGTAKASAADRKRVRHHLIDFLPTDQDFTVAQFVELASQATQDILQRGKIPLLSGGTALYYRALLEGLFAGPDEQPEWREEWRQIAVENGVDFLHSLLAAEDPKSAAAIHPNDLRRVIRALEVWRATGKSIREQQTQWNRVSPDTAESANCVNQVSLDLSTGILTKEMSVKYHLAGLKWPRPVLHERISQRVMRMRQHGLLAEAKWVFENQGQIARGPLQAVAWKEFFPYFRGEEDEDAAFERLQAQTRKLAKSQDTWFRKFPVDWIDMNENISPEKAAEMIVSQW